MNSIKRYLTLGIGVGFVLASMVMAAFDPEKKMVQPAPEERVLPPREAAASPVPASPQVKLVRQYHVYIPPNLAANDIAEMLKTVGVIGETGEFLKRVEELGAASRLNYGLFQFQEGDSLNSVVAKLIEG